MILRNRTIDSIGKRNCNQRDVQRAKKRAFRGRRTRYFTGHYAGLVTLICRRKDVRGDFVCASRRDSLLASQDLHSPGTDNSPEICISATPPLAQKHARYLVKRLGAAVPAKIKQKADLSVTRKGLHFLPGFHVGNLTDLLFDLLRTANSFGVCRRGRRAVRVCDVSTGLQRVPHRD
jgi:hypothetical protein